MTIRWDKRFAEKYHSVELTEKKYILGPSIRRILRASKGKKLIDLGCGSGHYCRIFAKMNKKVTGIDKNLEQLNIAIEKEDKQKLGIKYIKSDITNIKIKSDTFDIALLNFVLIEQPSTKIVKKIFKECYRLLRRNGTLVIGGMHPHNINIKNKNRHFTLKNKNASYFDNAAIGTSIALLTNGKKLVFKGDHHYTLEFLVNSLIVTGFNIQLINELTWKEKFPIDIVIVAKKR